MNKRAKRRKSGGCGHIAMLELYALRFMKAEKMKKSQPFFGIVRIKKRREKTAEAAGFPVPLRIAY